MKFFFSKTTTVNYIFLEQNLSKTTSSDVSHSRTQMARMTLKSGLQSCHCSHNVSSFWSWDILIYCVWAKLYTLKKVGLFAVFWERQNCFFIPTSVHHSLFINKSYHMFLACYLTKPHIKLWVLKSYRVCDCWICVHCNRSVWRIKILLECKTTRSVNGPVRWYHVAFWGFSEFNLFKSWFFAQSFPTN